MKKFFLSAVALAILAAFFSARLSSQQYDVSSSNDAPALRAIAADDSSSSLTFAQVNAVRSAKQYLAIAGFSREGLLQQLTSDVGGRYAERDALAAIDSMDIDWNQNAVRSAKAYLNVSGFSCEGLVEQLSASAGSNYTEAQARYGATQAGVCN